MAIDEARKILDQKIQAEGAVCWVPNKDVEYWTSKTGRLLPKETNVTLGWKFMVRNGRWTLIEERFVNDSNEMEFRHFQLLPGQNS